MTANYYCDGSKLATCVARVDELGAVSYLVYPFNLALGYTTNEAEWIALFDTFGLAINHDDHNFTVLTDSELMHRQWIGKYKIKDKKLKHWSSLCRYRAKCNELAPHLRWVPREENLAGIYLEQWCKNKRKEN